MVNILVVGGAGYIGAHTCLDLASKGFTPVVFDNLSNGHAEFVRWGPLEEGDIRDRSRLESVMEAYRPAAIVHFAALIEVGHSVADPLTYYENNVGGTLSLLSAARRFGIDKLIFSSTCATYGVPQTVPMTEAHAQAPISPYGRSKLLVETILRDLDASDTLRSVCLRYFNAAGADPQGRIGEWHDPETHVIPLAIETALGRRPAFQILGTDYPTPDGSCVRDFVHVLDLADAHSRAVQYLLDGGASVALNLGTGRGTTVLELVGEIERRSGRPLPVVRKERRPGDPPTLVADNALARQTLDWAPAYDLSAIIDTAWTWHTRTNLTAS